MDKDEFDQLVKDLHSAGLNEDQIMKVLYETYITEQCSLSDYEIMVHWLGYELTDEFYQAHGIKK